MLRKDRWWIGWIKKFMKMVRGVNIIKILCTIWIRRSIVTAFVEDTVTAITQMNHTKRTSRGLADTEEESDEYMDIVFSLCAAHERQGYMEGLKVGARLMMELMED